MFARKPKTKRVKPSSFGYYEPELGLSFLPRCAHCEAPHPRARRPAIDMDKCPDCGNSVVAAGATIHVSATLTGYSPSILLARALFAIAGLLRSLAQGFQK